ncbi:hypothetical protein ACIA8K_03795 [Catenuloplanes sp. NPDC051500]|uniref:hypothetical protein n=1 Tax=Catenuloplanes sp. NPDC051500 TaxID=3363959 RepID=UPI0037B06276
MTLPLTSRTMDAICLEHVVPTSTGNHVFNAPPSSMAQDTLLGEAQQMLSVDKYAYVSFGIGMRDALTDTSAATTLWEDGIARPTGALSPEKGSVRALMYQYFRGIPAEALDRLVERPLFGRGQEDVRMSLADLAARADMMGLPVEIPIERLADGGEPIPSSRIVHFDTSGPATPANATLIRVEPARVWDANPFVTTGPDVRAEALKDGYPGGRIVPVDGGKRLGMASALAEFQHADLLRDGRALTGNDLTRDGVPPLTPVATYGDLLAHVAGADGTYSLIEVRADGAADSQVFVAVHDAAGDAFLDLGTGTTAVFPDLPEQIRVSTLPVDTVLADLLRDPAATGGVPAQILPPPGVTRTHTFGAGGSRSVDLVGGFGGPGVPKDVLDKLSVAAEAIGQSVIVIGPPPRDKWSRRHPERAEKRFLLRAEHMAFQHLQNREPAPIIFNYGGVSTALDRMAEKWGSPVIQQSMGGGLDFDRKWAAAGVPPFKDLTGETLKAVGDLQRANTAATVEPELASYLSMTFDNPAAVREKLATDGSSLKALQHRIAGLPADPELFRAHSKLLDLLGREDGSFDRAVEYLASAKGGTVPALPDLPSVLKQAPEARAGALEDLKAVTYGTHDDGAARAVLDAVQKRLAGESEEVVKKAIYDNSVYLPEGPGGRADIVRTLQGWRDGASTAQERAVFDEMAIWVTTCP